MEHLTLAEEGEDELVFHVEEKEEGRKLLVIPISEEWPGEHIS